MERYPTVVIGAGQAGLSASYHLTKAGLEHIVLDRASEVGDAWRQRWDSLRLFTPAAWDGLPGMPVPGKSAGFPSKDELADYFLDYARQFALPVRGDIEVTSVEQIGERYRLTTPRGDYEADNVIVATGTHALPRIPAFAGDLSPAVRQLHSSGYKGPAQLRDGMVLVVGAATSGVEIAIEVARAGHRTALAGRSPRQIPKIARVGDGRLFWWFASHVLTIDTPIGRRARHGAQAGASPLIRTGLGDVDRAGVERVPRVVEVGDGRPVLADGRSLDVENVVWCTGYRHDFSWIRLGIFDEHGMPRHVRGVVLGQPGLYFIGLPFLYSLTSGLVGGVGRDAHHIVGHLSARRSAAKRRGSVGAPVAS